MATPVSLLDLAIVPEGHSPGDALHRAVRTAQLAEDLGFHRFWMAEHHNMPGVASAATSVALAHVGAHTSTIRIGAGGIMLPNHAPLMVAEQFGTLAALHPDRVDLGLGRAPGTDPLTIRALRRSPESAQTFPRDVMELLGYLDGGDGLPVRAWPGDGSRVPVWLLGSSLFSAQLAAHLGLPFAFASHFAPMQLHGALQAYHEGFQPSRFLDAPHVMVAMNVYAADTEAEARRLFTSVQLQFLRLRTGRPGKLQPPSEQPIDPAQLQAAGVSAALARSAVGTVEQVREQVGAFLDETRADELIVTSMMFREEDQRRSLTLLAEALGTLTTTEAVS